jgi:small subunit ribosomal protein S18
MARPAERERNTKRSSKESKPRAKKRVCLFCKERADWVDYKDVTLLRRFMSDRAKIRSRRVTGNCTQHQRAVQVAIKTARELALLPYVQRTASERGLGRPRAGQGQEEPLESGAGLGGSAYEADEAEEEEPAQEDAGAGPA